MSFETNSNPYACDASGGKTEPVPSKDHTSVDFAPILRRWERLRLYYNGFLILVVLLLIVLVFPEHLGDFEFWVCVSFGGLVANLCFLTGPALEGYGTYFRFWNSSFRMLLFLTGLGLTTLLAIFTISNYSNF